VVADVCDGSKGRSLMNYRLYKSIGAGRRGRAVCRDDELCGDVHTHAIRVPPWA